MHRRLVRSPATPQLNLPLPHAPACLVPADKEAELVLALVELLVRAAHRGLANGGGDESEADR